MLDTLPRKENANPKIKNTNDSSLSYDMGSVNGSLHLGHSLWVTLLLRFSAEGM